MYDGSLEAKTYAQAIKVLISKKGRQLCSLNLGICKRSKFGKSLLNHPSLKDKQLLLVHVGGLLAKMMDATEHIAFLKVFVKSLAKTF
jgi:hypothetical protein